MPGIPIKKYKNADSPEQRGSGIQMMDQMVQPPAKCKDLHQATGLAPIHHSTASYLD